MKLVHAECVGCSAMANCYEPSPGRGLFCGTCAVAEVCRESDDELLVSIDGEGMMPIDGVDGDWP